MTLALYKHAEAITVADSRGEAIEQFIIGGDYGPEGFDVDHVRKVPSDDLVEIPLTMVSLKEHLRESENAFMAALCQSFDDAVEVPMIILLLQAGCIPAIVKAGYVWDLQG